MLKTNAGTPKIFRELRARCEALRIGWTAAHEQEVMRMIRQYGRKTGKYMDAPLLISEVVGILLEYYRPADAALTAARGALELEKEPA